MMAMLTLVCNRYRGLYDDGLFDNLNDDWHVDLDDVYFDLCDNGHNSVGDHDLIDEDE